MLLDQVQEMETPVGANKDDIRDTSVDKMEKLMSHLKDQTDDLKNTKRPRKTRRPRYGGIFGAVHTQLLGNDTFTLTVTLERAHSIGKMSERARTILAKFLNFRDKKKVLQLASSKAEITYENKMHYSVDLQRRRDAFTDVKRMLREKDVRNTLLYVRHQGSLKFFSTPAEVQSFLKELKRTCSETDNDTQQGPAQELKHPEGFNTNLHLQIFISLLLQPTSRRVLSMTNVKAATFFLLTAALGLLILHLCKSFLDHEMIHLHHENVRDGDGPTREHVKNNSYVFSWPRCQQNMSAANITGFSSLPDYIKDFLYHRHCRHFPVRLDIPDKCGGADKSADVFLLLVIKSSPRNYDRREVLRKTWAKERLQNGVWIRRIFISGTTDSGFEKKRLNELLKLEHREHNDILQWDFNDTFYNLTLKQILFLEWMERNCPNARFLMNGDDDVFANTDNMVEYLQSLKDNNGSKHLFTGHLIQNVGPIRSSGSKYFIPVQVQESESYPPYCGGGGFLLSGYTASVIYNMSHSITILPIDDVYMGMCLAKAGLGPESHMGVKTAGLYIPSRKHDEYDPCFYKEVILVHRFLSANMFLTWQRIHNPDLKCGSKTVTHR